jgi:hypothetical protein
MATRNKTAYVDVNFAITVRVPVDPDILPEHSEVGDDVESNISSDLWNQIVSTACDRMEGPDGSNVESIVISELDGEDDEPDDDFDNEDMYNDSPEYIHDAALDWMYEHRDFLDDIGEDAFIARCADELAEEGYNTADYYWAVEEAFDDMD